MISIGFGKLCICRTYAWNTYEIVKVCNQESVNVDSTQRNKKRAHLPKEPGPKTYAAALIAQQQTIMRKAVAGRPHLGATSPRVRSHHQLHQTPLDTTCHLLVTPP